MAKRKRRAARPARRARPARPEKAQEFFRGASLMLPDDVAPAGDGDFDEVPELRQRLFLRAFAATGRIDAAAKAAGVTPKATWNWRHDGDPVFDAAFRLATAMAVEAWEGELARRGFRGVERPVYQGGRLVGTVRDFDTPAATFMLKGAAPEKYRERVDASLSGPAGGPIPVAAAVLTDEALLARLDQLRADLAGGPLSSIVPAGEPATGQLTAPAAVVAEEAPGVSAYEAALAARLAARNGSGSNGNGSNGHGSG